jgi:hypothetical protein
MKKQQSKKSINEIQKLKEIQKQVDSVVLNKKFLECITNKLLVLNVLNDIVNIVSPLSVDLEHFRINMALIFQKELNKKLIDMKVSCSYIARYEDSTEIFNYWLDRLKEDLTNEEERTQDESKIMFTSRFLKYIQCRIDYLVSLKNIFHYLLPASLTIKVVNEKYLEMLVREWHEVIGRHGCHATTECDYHRKDRFKNWINNIASFDILNIKDYNSVLLALKNK